MKPLRVKTEEFIKKAEELGLLADIDAQLEQRKYNARLVVLEKIKQLPPVEKTEIPAVVKACIAARKEFELCQDRVRAAEQNFNTLSCRVYGLENQFNAARVTLEQEAIQMAPGFLRDLHADLGFLDGLVSGQFRYQINSVGGFFSFGGRTETTNNGVEIQTCRAAIVAGRARAMAMMLEPTTLDEQRAEVKKIFESAAEMAYKLGVQKGQFVARHEPPDHAGKAEDERHKRSVQRRAAIDAAR